MTQKKIFSKFALFVMKKLFFHLQNRQNKQSRKKIYFF